MGAINGAFNLDVALKALESEGQLKIISTPRITTQNNQMAEVTTGFEIPYQVVTTTGGVTSTSIQFKDAALKLLVTPKITPANTVIMKIQLENGTPSTSLVPWTTGPSIQTDRANTLVQVADGNTTVIGGILATTDSSRRRADAWPEQVAAPRLALPERRRATTVRRNLSSSSRRASSEDSHEIRFRDPSNVRFSLPRPQVAAGARRRPAWR